MTTNFQTNLELFGRSTFQQRAAGLQIFMFLKLERYLTINDVMTLKDTVTGPILEKINVDKR